MKIPTKILNIPIDRSTVVGVLAGLLLFILAIAPLFSDETDGGDDQINVTSGSRFTLEIPPEEQGSRHEFVPSVEDPHP